MRKIISKSTKLTVYVSLFLIIYSVFSIITLLLIKNPSEVFAKYLHAVIENYMDFTGKHIREAIINDFTQKAGIFYYIFLLVASGISIGISIVLLILSVKVNKGIEYSLEDLYKRKSLHIAYLLVIIFTLLLVCVFSTPTGGIIISCLRIATLVMLNISLVEAIIILVLIPKQYKKSIATNESNDNNEDLAKAQERKKIMYELLGKLEKQYNDGKISKEDYLRMKKTIFDTYIKY